MGTNRDSPLIRVGVILITLPVHRDESRWLFAPIRIKRDRPGFRYILS